MRPSGPPGREAAEQLAQQAFVPPIEPVPEARPRRELLPGGTFGPTRVGRASGSRHSSIFPTRLIMHSFASGRRCTSPGKSVSAKRAKQAKRAKKGPSLTHAPWLEGGAPLPYFGLRRQSAAATALWLTGARIEAARWFVRVNQSGVALRLPPQSKKPPWCVCQVAPAKKRSPARLLTADSSRISLRTCRRRHCQLQGSDGGRYGDDHEPSPRPNWRGSCANTPQ